MESTADKIFWTLELEDSLLVFFLWKKCIWKLPFYVIARMVKHGSSVYYCTIQQITNIKMEVILR